MRRRLADLWHRACVWRIVLHLDIAWWMDRHLYHKHDQRHTERDGRYDLRDRNYFLRIIGGEHADRERECSSVYTRQHHRTRQRVPGCSTDVLGYAYFRRNKLHLDVAGRMDRKQHDGEHRDHRWRNKWQYHGYSNE